MRSFERLHERAVIVVLSELGIIAWVRRKYMDTPWSCAIIQAVIGGLLDFGVGILIGNT